MELLTHGVSITYILLVSLWTTYAGLFATYTCIGITRDWRQRAFYAQRTADLTETQLEIAYIRNLAIVASFVQKRPMMQRNGQSADRSLIMCTVLQEHLARVRGEPLPRSYLRERKMCLRAAKKFEPSEDHPTYTPQA